jgi:Tol biopolymer transport system component
LRLVFTHEYTHVVHLEKSRGWLGSLRHVFGRVPLFYANLFLPPWQIEGIATFEESAAGEAGRLHAGDFRMVVDHAAAANQFAPLDRATTALIDWPGGSSAYLYGVRFHEYLAARYGEASFPRLADETAGRLPFLGSPAFKEVYGKSLGELWKEFAAETRAKAAASVRVGGERQTSHGFSVTAPAFTPDGRLFYSTANPHGFPALMELVDGEPREVTTRYHGRRLSAAANVLVFDQLEVDGHVGLLSDVYALDLRTRDVRRLTHGARAADPDITRDARTIVCTIQQPGRRLLATMSANAGGGFGQPVPLVSDADTEYTSPRWSPDAGSIVAERRRLGGPSELVVIDTASRSVRVLLSVPTGRLILPTWTPEGSRVLFSWDRDGAPFALHTVDVNGGGLRQLVNAGDGAHAPTFSPDGSRMVFVGYTAEGYDLFSLDAALATWKEVVAPQAASAAPPAQQPVTEPIVVRPYSPLDTLLPRAWSPYVERDGDDTIVGATTVGFDALGRHTYFVAAGWGIPRNIGDVQAEYTYARWRPAFFAGLSDDTDARGDDFVRARDLSAGVLVPFRRVRWASDLLTAASYSTDDLIDDDGEVRATRERTAGRVGLRFSTARTFGYSISAEEGFTASLVGEFAHGAESATARSVVADARVFIPVAPRHGVVAARAAYATSRGDERVRRDFFADGSGPQSAGLDVDADAIGLLRGFDEGDVFGRSAVVFNADYRVPLGWPQRGYGTVPVFLRAVHAALFFDTAQAWDDTFRASDMRRSVGAELSFDIVLGNALPTTFATGIAIRHDPVNTRDRVAAFFRVGRAF